MAESATKKNITLEEMKKIEIEILEQIDRICKENGIVYSLMDGSLLGAIRHKGFIPWDDDIDIMMPRPDYDKLRNIMVNSPIEGLKYLSAEVQDDCSFAFAKVVYTKTTIKEYKAREIKDYGVFVDIFPVDGIYENKIKRFYQTRMIGILRNLIRIAGHETQISENKIKLLLKNILALFTKIIGMKKMVKYAQKLMTKCDYKKSKHVTILYSDISIQRKKFFEKNMYEETSYMPFENTEFRVINRYDQYLKEVFGDYMTPPPIENQVSHHKFDRLEWKEEQGGKNVNNDYVFLFDLDSTITKEEILPTIARKVDKEKEMRELTEKTMMGDLIFKESIKKRVELLKEIPISEAEKIVEEIQVSDKLVKFLKENKEKCYIVTSNLDVWIDKLMKKIGMEGHYFCSKAKTSNGYIVEIESILSKEDVVKKFKGNVIAIGDGSNDREMINVSRLGIGYGGVREISPTLMNVIDYAVYDEDKLYELLNKILQVEDEKNEQDDKTIIISCAGMGKRLGMEKPKALVEVNGKPLIIRNLELLKSCEDIRIVVGYKANEVIRLVNSYRKDIVFVFNNNYMNNGTGASVSIASRYAKKYILTIDGDLLIHPEDISSILEEKEEFIGVTNPSTDNPVLVATDNGKVVEFSRKSGEFEWTGISLLKKSRLIENDGYVYQLIEPLLPLKYKIIRTKEIDTINDLKNAEEWVKDNYPNKYHIGYTCGVFDLFHIGHLNLLERCKKMCDILIVGVCNDDYVRNVKNKEPVFSEDHRVRIIKALKCVDDAVLVDIETTNDKMLAINKFRFDVLFSGDDWKNTERYNKTEKEFAKIGAKIEYLPYTKEISTTMIKEKIKNL